MELRRGGWGSAPFRAVMEGSLEDCGWLQEGGGEERVSKHPLPSLRHPESSCGFCRSCKMLVKYIPSRTACLLTSTINSGSESPC